MKKIIIPLLLLMLTFYLYAEQPTSDQKTTQQVISGYIDDLTVLTVSPYTYATLNNGKGINLDYTDTTNNVNRYLIAPTSTALTEAGLPVGTFSLIATFTSGQSARLTITHDKLTHTMNPTIKVDYELGIKYTLNNGNSVTEMPAVMCFSSDSTITSISSQKSIIISLPGTNGSISIRDAIIYFRLTAASPVSQNGDYTSKVTFQLEAL